MCQEKTWQSDCVFPRCCSIQNQGFFSLDIAPKARKTVQPKRAAPYLLTIVSLKKRFKEYLPTYARGVLSWKITMGVAERGPT